MITLKIQGLDNLVCGSLKDFEAEIDIQNKQVLIFYQDKLLGPLLAVYGISDDDFIKNIKIKKEK